MIEVQSGTYLGEASLNSQLSGQSTAAWFSSRSARPPRGRGANLTILPNVVVNHLLGP